MEEIHGVDVSWLHRPNKEHHHRSSAPSTPGLAQDVRPPTSSHGGLPADQQDSKAPPTSSSAQPAKTAPAPPPAQTNNAPFRRPGILNRDKPQDRSGTGDGTKKSRRDSWINNISSKFSSSSSASGGPPPSPSTAQTSRPIVNGASAGSSSQTAKEQLSSSSPTTNQRSKKEAEELQPYVPQKPRDGSSFFSSISRRLSSGQQTGSGTKVLDNGGVCPRRIMNVDHNRERCHVPELELRKLRRVSFSVDVEIASGPKYADDTSPANKEKQAKDNKAKEKAEGMALKNPDAITQRKENNENVDGTTDTKDTAPPTPTQQRDAADDDDADAEPGKPHRTEEEKAERREKKRRKAEESGQIPVEVGGDNSDDALSPNASVPASGTATPKNQDRPTTDPVRIYRRCCQLRESPILKRITEQLMAPDCTLPEDPGVVTELRLIGSRLQPPDVVTLSDWLAIVPVKRLLLEDADLNDEGLRVILAGLLAAKRPEPTKRRNGQRQWPGKPTGGMIEKLTLKNNPRISKVGWKHISLFLYMCRSIKMFDVSMIEFPSTVPPPSPAQPVKTPLRIAETSGKSIDTADLICKSLTERRGGSQLQELTMAECGLNAEQIGKILEGATKCSVTRVGLAGNHLDEAGFEHILKYVRSGVCSALDLGSNDLQGKMGRLSQALVETPNCPIWGLSLANCNLDTDCLKQLLPALEKLKDFRFFEISHNSKLFDSADCSLQVVRKYLPKLVNLKRLHLRDVGLATKHVISLAGVLPESPALVHLVLLENPELTALATRTDEKSQEEACALYASLMTAARISESIVCIDIDVPSPELGEIVRALAKQVVAYCLRNMDRTMTEKITGDMAATLSKPHGVEDARQTAVPDILRHLVGHGDADHHDTDASNQDEDYIVGGNGLVKALEYFLSEEATDMRRASLVPPSSGTVTPREREQANERKGKAKEVSKNMLDSARKMRRQLQPALARELASGDDIAYRRMLFLDDTLKGMIQRFEDEYPETRVSDPTLSSQITASLPSLERTETQASNPLWYQDYNTNSSVPSLATETSTLSLESDDEDAGIARRPSILSGRKGSDVGMAGRALALEEGRIHRAGQTLRRDIIAAPPFSVPFTAPPVQGGRTVPYIAPRAVKEESQLSEIAQEIEGMSGEELKEVIDHQGWDGVMKKLGVNFGELRQLQERDPVGWEQLKESQVKAAQNMRRPGEGESAVE